MSNPIEVPENIIGLAKKILEDSACYGDNSLELANFITSAIRPEIEVEPFVIYKIQVGGDETPRIGFRVKKDVPYPWVILNIDSTEKEEAYPVSAYNQIHKDEDIKVLERWTPEAPQPEFGIGESDASVLRDRAVLVKGVLNSTRVDIDGDVRVEMKFGRGTTETHYVSAKDVAYAEEGK